MGFLTLFSIWIALNQVIYPVKSGNKMVTLFFAHDVLAALDPLGASLTKGPDLYFQLPKNIAFSLKKYLSSGS